MSEISNETVPLTDTNIRNTRGTPDTTNSSNYVTYSKINFLSNGKTTPVSNLMLDYMFNLIVIIKK